MCSIFCMMLVHFLFLLPLLFDLPFPLLSLHFLIFHLSTSISPECIISYTFLFASSFSSLHFHLSWTCSFLCLSLYCLLLSPPPLPPPQMFSNSSPSYLVLSLLLCCQANVVVLAFASNGDFISITERVIILLLLLFLFAVSFMGVLSVSLIEQRIVLNFTRIDFFVANWISLFKFNRT